MPSLISPPTKKPLKYLAPVTMPGRDAHATLVLLGLNPLGMCAEYPDTVSVVVRTQLSVGIRKLSTLFGILLSIDEKSFYWEIPGCGKVFLRSTSKPRTCVVSFNLGLTTQKPL